MTIALLGTGLLGRALAVRLQSVGYTVTVDNRTATKALSPLSLLHPRGHATGVGDDPSRLWSPHVGLCGDDPCRPADGRIGRIGRSYCEPPVLGNLAKAQAGTIFVMGGGTEGRFVRWGPLLRSLDQ
jgi:3-hydroxyisobutyrate dehydrogenase-like beta-hydroxyacid dehydrogenase